jgi:hypothetical protein
MADEFLSKATEALQERDKYVGHAEEKEALLRVASANALVSIAHSLDSLANQSPAESK